jgi:FtsH-binding integral membrane protein
MIGRPFTAAGLFAWCFFHNSAAILTFAPQNSRFFYVDSVNTNVYSAYMSLLVLGNSQTRGRELFRRFWQASPPLTLVVLAMLATLFWLVPAMWLDARTVDGAPLWTKPTKFALSIAIYSVTLLFMLRYVQGAPRLTRMASHVIAAMFVVEMILITGQAARGRVSHFNVSTGEDMLIFNIMGGAIMILVVAHVLIAIVLLRQRNADDTVLTGLRAGLLVAVLGMLIGPLMTIPTGEQLDLLKQGQNPGRAGAHTVGAPDGGPGLPFTGWSTGAGDLRVAHFFGIHAMQALPLFAFWLRRRKRLAAPIQRRIVRIWAAAYAGLTLTFVIQAYRQQALTAPDSWTLAMLLGLPAAAFIVSLWSARRFAVS